MPGSFTHIYTARRVADLLLDGDFTDWPDLGQGGNAVHGYSPRECGLWMRTWEKFTAVGAVGPDIFFFSQDWNNDALGPGSDDIMLALAVYYFFDAAKDDWEPLLPILDGVDSTLTAFIRSLIKLQKIWSDFVAVWDRTVGPLVDGTGALLDDLTGGVLVQFRTALTELRDAVETIGVQEISRFAALRSAMSTVVAQGWSEDSFLWSDMTHYRRTSATCQALVKQAEALRDGSEEGEQRFEQFMAFALGWIVHVGTDTIGHSFVNAQCGGPYRDHPTRHHLIENHIDAWNYARTGEGGTIPADAWGRTDDYPELSSSALWFAVQLTPDDPGGAQRPSPLSHDPDIRNQQLDVDGELPGWLTEGIVQALIESFADHPHPKLYRGDAFQQLIDSGKLTTVVKDVTGHGLDRPFSELVDRITPAPPFPVPRGFPLPWEVGTAYQLMITLYKLTYDGGWELPKPRLPDGVPAPPLEDFTDRFQPPDFSGVDGDKPVEDVCDVLIALVQWIVKELAATIELIGDLITAGRRPGPYLTRLALYEIALKVWDVATKMHDVLAHTGLLVPHAEARHPDNGELRWPNEIDLPLITLGATMDGAFKQALADAVDPFGNLDKNRGVVVSHSIRDRNYPYYPPLRYHPDGSAPDDRELRRPWAYPRFSELEQNGDDIEIATPTETYDPSTSGNEANDVVGPAAAHKPMRAGPYPEGTTPDQVFFRTDAPVDREGRTAYESARTPWQTDLLNEQHIGTSRRGLSPLGDPVPFSAYLIGRIVNPTAYATQFNLDADRAYAYLTWDWNRGNEIGETAAAFKYQLPVAAPWLDLDRWKRGAEPMQLHYVDPPARVDPPAHVVPPAHVGPPPSPAAVARTDVAAREDVTAHEDVADADDAELGGES